MAFHCQNVEAAELPPHSHYITERKKDAAEQKTKLILQEKRGKKKAVRRAMSKAEDFKLFKIQTVVLKVHIHCDGCKQEVKKLLQKIEGIYTVIIDAEQQKVTVAGDVDSGTLIKKLARSGKHAELWPHKSTSQSNRPSHPQHQQHLQQHQAKDGKKKNNNWNKGQSDQALIQGLKAFKHQHSTADSFSSDNEDLERDDFDDEDEDDENLGLDLLKKLKLPNNAAGAKKTLHTGGNGNKRPGETYPNRPTGSQYSNMPQAKGLNAAQPNNRMANNGLMGLAALQGHGLQAQHQLGANFSTAFPTTGNHQAPLMVNLQGQGYQNQPSSMMTNSRGMNNPMANINNSSMLMNESRFMQPQVMYNKSPHIPPYTGYYYPCPYYQSLYYNHHPETGGGVGHGDHHPLSDECSSGCVVM
ncbi:heavy metal-associated isoprenylated plant protein 37-like [Zingiber officinale]|uniref:heavy metal-associated isoprenylated plant protein 37-like n=1 Tax=Zingiber officinale TaxID=94328 RepID=UPI001C4D063B|nr:heavy metal-associated isoprenylated plant protein 37-like [Zingiber officinale]